MATLETLRNKAGIFVSIVIGLALLAFILSDLLSPGRSIFSGNEMEIGQAEGVSLSYPEFQQKFDYQLAMMQNFSDQPNSEHLTQQVRDQIWQQFVRQQVLGHECERLGLAFSSDELSSYVLGNETHPIVNQIFTNPETGQFDRERMLYFLQNLDDPQSGVTREQRDYWFEVEREISEERIMRKFQTLVAKGLYVTQREAQREATLRGRQVDVAYCYKSYNAVPDSAVSVTASEAQAYYKAHRELFRGVERRNLAYVTFPVKASERDIETAQEAIKRLRDEFQSSQTPMVFALQNGENTYRNSWYTREELPSAVADWVFSNPSKDSVSPLLRENDEFIYARVLAIRNLPDSANARHILFSNQHYIPARAQELADSILNELKSGKDFAKLAEKFSDDPGSKAKGGALDWFPQGVMVKPFNDACFLGKIGDVKIVTSNFGVHILEVLGQRGSTPRAEVALLNRKIVPGNTTYQQVFNDASSFAAIVHQPRPSWIARVFGAGKERAAEAELLFDSLAQERDLGKRLASGVEEAWPRISGLNNSREMIRWAYEAHPGDISPVFEMEEQFAVALLLKVEESDGTYSAFDAVKDDVVQAVMLRKKQELLKKELQEATTNDSDIHAVASGLGQAVKRASSIAFNAYALGAEGFEPGPVGVATSLPVGKLAGPVDGMAGVYLLQAEAAQETPQDATQLQESSREELQRRTAYQAYETLREMSDVVDKRAKFF